MKNWESTLVGADLTLRHALGIIDKAGTRMVLVVDEQRKLLGTLSDGDIRRGLLRGVSLEEPVANAMHANPTTARSTDIMETVLASMKARGVYQMPIVNAEGIVVGLQTIDDILTPQKRDSWVVIMAGGRGTRLAELTRDTPKPMLKVGTRPLLETIVSNFVSQGFHRFFLSVNYKAEQIASYFGNGSSFGAEIEYIREKQPLGTAGALGLLREQPQHPMVVTNADLLTKENYGRMLDRHIEAGAIGTMAVRSYEMQVPFGVVQEQDGMISAIEEKPIQTFMVNAGMYVLSPDALKLIPRDQPLDMPSLFENLMQSGLKTRCHHIDAYWLDIGRMADYERANVEFSEIFQ